MEKKSFMLSEQEMDVIESASLKIENEKVLETSSAAAAIPALVGAFVGIPTKSY